MDGLAGSESAKERLKAILRTLAGEIPVGEACEALGIGEAMFHRMRTDFLGEAVGLLEPKPVGRKPRGRSQLPI